MSWSRKCLAAANARSGSESNGFRAIISGFLSGFGRALRAEGLQIGSAEVEPLYEGVAKAQVKSPRAFIGVGRVCLTASPEQIPVYDRVFSTVVPKHGDATFPAALALHQEEPGPSSSDCDRNYGSSDKPYFGRAAAWGERLGFKRIPPA